MNVAPILANPRRFFWFRRVGRGLGTLVIAASFVLVAAFAFDYVAHPLWQSTPWVMRGLVGLGILVGPGWLLWSRFRSVHFHFAPWLGLIGSLVLLGVWLAHDEDTLAYDTEHRLLRSDFPEAAATHALVLRYSKGVQGALHDSLPETSLIFPSLSDEAAKREVWVDFIVTNRNEIHARWEQLAPKREWFDALAAAPALADLTTRVSDPIPGFGPLRAVAQTAAAQASLLALDGRCDEAVGVLLPVLVAGQKLEIHARTLVRRMVAVVLQRQALAALGFVLDQGAIDDVTGARLAEALLPHQDPEEGARLLVWCEHELSARIIVTLSPSAFEEESDEDRARPRSPWVFFYNPIATANRMSEILHLYAEAAAQRDLEAMRKISADTELILEQPSAGKNHVGRMLLAMMIPGFSKVVESYWKAHDERTALLARLPTGWGFVGP